MDESCRMYEIYTMRSLGRQQCKIPVQAVAGGLESMEIYTVYFIDSSSTVSYIKTALEQRATQKNAFLKKDRYPW